jgi:hypothetical protein
MSLMGEANVDYGHASGYRADSGDESANEIERAADLANDVDPEVDAGERCSWREVDWNLRAIARSQAELDAREAPWKNSGAGGRAVEGVDNSHLRQRAHREE